MYKTIKAEEIPVSLSAIKRIGQRFETTGNVARRIWKAQSLIIQGWPPAEMCSSQTQERKPTKTVNRIQDLRKQDSFKKNNSQKVI